MYKRIISSFRKGDILDISEFHDGRYGGPGGTRKTKAKPTEEEMHQANWRAKKKRCRQRLLMYFKEGDCWATWTYAPQNRPPDMKAALKDFQDAMRCVRREYKKRGYEVFWIRNIERGTKGAWHIHLNINEIGDTASIITKVWKKGGTWISELRKSKYYSEDYDQLAAYITKDERTVEKKQDGTLAKPRIAESNYNTSRNMPLPPPKKQYLKRWREEVKPKKGYYIARIYEGINPKTGYKYRSYTMIRLNRRD